MKRIYPILFLLSFVFQLSAQDTIQLSNPSFEDIPRHSKAPRDWFDCGFPGESPPDIQPSGTFNVTRPAYDGKTYLAMVTRDNNTWESVTTKLNAPLEIGNCYVFKLFLCRSELYVSTSRITKERANYTNPIKVKIWGGHSQCDKVQLLDQSELVTSHEWEDHILVFFAEESFSHIVIEAYYRDDFLSPYNGNVLIDHASIIERIDCEDADYQKPSVYYEGKDDRTANSTYQEEESEVEIYEDDEGYEVLTLIELEEILLAQIPELVFQDNGDLDLEASQPALESIRDALDRASNHRMVLAVSEKDNPNFRNQYFSLQEAFSKFEFWKKRYKIRAYKKSDKNTEWLWEDKALSLFMTIE